LQIIIILLKIFLKEIDTQTKVIEMKDYDKQLSRRKFIQQTAALGAGIMLTSPSQLFAETNQTRGKNMNIKSKGYAAVDTSGKLQSWEFERRPVGDNDILIDIKYASICHSDIHQMKGHWGPQQYPQVPGHEIVGMWLPLEKMLPNSRSVTERASDAWSIVVWGAKAAMMKKSSIAPKPYLLMATRKRALRREFHKVVIRPISSCGITLPSTFRTISVSRKQHHCYVPASPLIHP